MNDLFCNQIECSCRYIVRSEITHQIFQEFDQAAERLMYDDEFDGQEKRFSNEKNPGPSTQHLADGSPFLKAKQSQK